MSLPLHMKQTIKHEISGNKMALVPTCPPRYKISHLMRILGPLVLFNLLLDLFSDGREPSAQFTHRRRRRDATIFEST